MNIGQKSKNNRRKNREEDNGFAAWGGYMEAKKAKLEYQYKETATKQVEKVSSIFTGIVIFVNGFTNPSADDLKNLMAAHGGVYQVYQNSQTTHIIASNLPNVKINKLGTVPIVKPSWITDSIALNKLLDYRRYLLYTNQSTTQPKLEFPKTSPPSKTKTASDPNFLEEFYNNSRLHLIATLGAEYKHLITEWREKEPHFSSREKLLAYSGECPPQGQVIMHIDMDCFFVSVGLRNHPELRGLPVAVTHARNPQTNKEREAAVTLNTDRLPQGVEGGLIDGKSSMSEIASCSYEARKCGVKNGMFLGAAAKLCPGIKTIPYDFEGYKEVSMTLYKTLASYTLDIEAVSCDEMYVDITSLLQIFNISVETWAKHIRSEIMKATGCPCSTGFGSNRLQARLATKKAKPAGSYYLRPEDVETYMTDIPLSDLPGVGRATLHKLNSLGLETCGDVQVASLHLLQKELGVKLGETLLEQAKGVDKKPLNYHYERKSVSAEINYGIRFKTIEECYNFLESLGNEVWSRLNDIKMRARCVTLKLMIRAADAPVETAKFLGHGVCDCLSKSITLNHPISDVKIIHREIKNIYDKMSVDFRELRGMGIQLSKLEKMGTVNTLNRFLQQTKSEVPGNSSRGSSKQRKTEVKAKNSTLNEARSSISDFFKSKKDSSQNKLQIRKEDVCLDVLKELPPEIRDEIIKEYDLPPTVAPPIPKPKLAEPVTKKSPFSGLQWHQLKPILYEWMKSSPIPSNYDVTLLGEHFRQLASDGNIDWLRIAMNFLHRNLSQLGCGWHKAYHSIEGLVQEGMVGRFGGRLVVKRGFECCDN